jgi:PAS domain S-box-containing protein
VKSRLRILLLEDNAHDAELIQELLEADYFVCEVICVQTRAEFVAGLKNTEIDIILADYKLPSFDGLSALKLAFDARPDLPFIFVSGSLGEEVAIEAVKIGATDYVVKARLSRLVPSVRRALREAQDRAERKKAEEAFRRSEQENARLYRDLAERERKIRRLIDSNIIGICVWHLEGAIVEANDAFLQLVQYSREDLVSSRVRWTDLTPVEWRERDQLALAELKETGSAQPYEKEYVCKDGNRVPVLIGPALFEGSGTEGVAFVLDLTERKQAEMAVRESEHKLRQFIETVPGFLWSAAPDGEPTQVSQQVLDYSGLRFEEFLRLGWKEYMHPDDFPETVNSFYHSIQTGTSWQAVHRLRRAADGEYRWHRARGEPLRDRQGRIIQWYGLTVDIDEAKKAEDQLRRSEAWLTQAQRLSRTGNCVYDATTTHYLYWSDESYRIWGFDPLQGLPSREDMWQRIHPNDRDSARKEVQEALHERKDLATEFRLLLPDGTVKYLEENSHHMFSSAGALIETLSTHVDVTGRKRAQEEHEKLRQLESDLAHMNRVSVMGELAATLSHEITQPITSARNNARAALHFLNIQTPDLSEVREALACVVDDADRVGDIVERIRDHIKRAPPRKARFDLNAAINEVIALARSIITKNGVTVQTRLADGLFAVQGDRVQLQQVVLNLILNAVEAMGNIEVGARELLISTEKEHTGILVAVRDSGPGIDPALFNRVFDAFYTTKSSGTGIGLSICRSIIDGHGGRLWTEANEPSGAVFQFTLPDFDRLETSNENREPREDNT